MAYHIDASGGVKQVRLREWVRLDCRNIETSPRVFLNIESGTYDVVVQGRTIRQVGDCEERTRAVLRISAARPWLKERVCLGVATKANEAKQFRCFGNRDLQCWILILTSLPSPLRQRDDEGFMAQFHDRYAASTVEDGQNLRS